MSNTMTEYERQQKQKYLRENILEKQYDAQQFMDFCQTLKGSVDIDSWSLAQLQNIVTKFIKQQQGKNDEFSGFQATPEIQSSKASLFDNWSSIIQPALKSEQKKQAGLNSIDLDFLQMMGMSPSPETKKVEPKAIQQPSKPQFNAISNNLQKAKPKNPNEEFLKKMQNQNFISVFSNSSPIVSNNNQFTQFEKTETSAKNDMSQSQNIKPIVPLPQQNLQKKQNFHSTTNISSSHQQASSISPPSIIKSEKDNSSTIAEQNFIAQIKCKQISKNRISSDSILCNITGHQIINPNVFVPKFVLYTVSTAPLNIQVKRRMKDFEQLRSLLKKMFPLTQIPHLQRYSRLSQTEPHVISKQKMYLESFLNALLMNPVLKCKILQDFLLCTDLQLIKKMFRQFQKVQKPRGIEDLWTMQGTVKLNTNMANRKYMNQQQLYADYVENSFVKLKTLYDQLMIYYQNTAKIISDISEVYDQLKQTTKTVNESFQPSLRFNSFQSMVGQISYIHKQLSDSLQTQAKNIHTQLKHIFKYESENISSLKQTMKTVGNIYQAYEKRSDKELAKRQSYQNKKLIQFKVGADIPSKNITVLKYQSAYCQNQFKEEICRYMDQLSMKLGARFQIFSALQISIAADMDITWREYQKFVQNREFNHMNKGK